MSFSENALPECQLISRLLPQGILTQQEGNRYRIFSLFFRNPEGKRIFFFFKRRKSNGDFCLIENLPFSFQGCHAAEAVGVHKEVLVQDTEMVLRHLHTEILVVETDLLNLSVGFPRGIDDAVPGEIIIRRTLFAVSAVSLEFLPVTVLPAHRLIDEIPDKAALIPGLPLFQLYILVHAPVGIPHGVRVFTEDEGLLRMLFKELLHLRGGRIHLRFHIACIIIAAVVGDAFVMNEPAAVQGSESLRHFINDAAAVGFISAGPDQDGRMVLVPPVAGIHAVQHHGQIFFPVSGKGCRNIFFPALDPVPDPVGFHVVLRDQVKSVQITQMIENRSVRVMGGADRVDVVPLHDPQVERYFLHTGRAACVAGELMPVCSMEHNPFPVQAHTAVPDFKAAETDIFADLFQNPAVFPFQDQFQLIQIRILRAPGFHILHAAADQDFILRRAFS